MLKLMKYEFRKQLLSKIIILISLVGLELFFCIALISDDNDLIPISILLLVFFTFGAMFFVSFEAILTFANDLRTKHSYMLFLTPNSAYKIVGAKVISAVIQISATWMAFGLIALFDIFLVTKRFSSIGDALSLVMDILYNIFSIKIEISDVIIVLLSIIVTWIATVIIGFLAITLSATFLANFKARGIISVALFFLLAFIMNKIRDIIVPSSTTIYNRSNFVSTCIVMAVFTAISYFVTSWMLDKKVSV